MTLQHLLNVLVQIANKVGGGCGEKNLKNERKHLEQL
jgi:hypothetical protein